MATPNYQQSRLLLLGAGSTVLVVTALVLVARAYDPAEVLAVILFLPVFVAAVLGGVRWGAGIAVLAGLGYAGLRAPDIQRFGWDVLASRVLAQFLAYVVFGALGGWAASVLTASIVKLDRFDVRDDDSELLNARGLLEQLGDEVARARRYGSTFSVVTVRLTLSTDVRAVRHQIGTAVRRAVRSVDEPGRVTIDGTDLVVTVLPETPPEGAEVAGRKIADLLEQEVAEVDADVRWLSHPEDDAEIQSLLDTLAEVVRREHPEASRRS